MSLVLGKGEVWTVIHVGFVCEENVSTKLSLWVPWGNIGEGWRIMVGKAGRSLLLAR
jgi:hypothetical protein